MMRKLIAIVALCLVSNFGFSPCCVARPAKVRFATLCNGANSTALAQFATGIRNGQSAAIGFSLLANRSTASAELIHFPVEEFTQVSGTVTTNFGITANTPFSVTVRGVTPDGVVHSGTAIVALPVNGAIAMTVTAQQLSPRLPANALLTDVTFSLANTGTTLPLVTITALAVNSQLSILAMDAPLSTCP
jgi:hypothetical protein